MLNQPEQQPWEAMPVRDKDWINFRCQLCGQCCRNLEDSVMVESLDAYRITKYLRDHGRPELEISNFFEEYTAVRILEGKLPIMTMNTVGDDHACVFLKDNRCSIYPARPRTCRHYPFSVVPGQRGRDFQWFLCMDKTFHFADGRVLVKDWINQNFPREEREFLKQDYAFLEQLGKYLCAEDDPHFDRCLQQILLLKYFFYDLDEPFLPQYERNMRALLERMPGLAGKADESENCNK